VRNVKWTFKIPARLMKCSVSLGIMFGLLRTGAMSPRLSKQSICRNPKQPMESRQRFAVAGDSRQGDIPDAISCEGRCRACGTPWALVVRMEGDRPVKIEGGCPNVVCVLGDW
jgi:hypothetical protein